MSSRFLSARARVELCGALSFAPHPPLPPTVHLCAQMVSFPVRAFTDLDHGTTFQTTPKSRKFYINFKKKVTPGSHAVRLSRRQ